MGFDRDEANNIYKKPECQEAYKLLKELEEKGFTAGEVEKILMYAEKIFSGTRAKLVNNIVENEVDNKPYTVSIALEDVTILNLC